MEIFVILKMGEAIFNLELIIISLWNKLNQVEQITLSSNANLEKMLYKRYALKEDKIISIALLLLSTTNNK